MEAPVLGPFRPRSTGPWDPPAGPVGRPTPPTELAALFDGACGVCTRASAWIGARDGAHRVERLDLRDPLAAARFPDLTPEAVREQLHVVDRDGVVTVGLDAVLAALAVLPGWRGIAWIGRVPGLHGLLVLAYRAFARNRLRFNRFLPVPAQTCTDACPLPPH